MKYQSIKNKIEIAETEDSWLVKRTGDNGDYITTTMKNDDNEEDNEESVAAIKKLMQEVLSEFLTLQRKYAKNWIEIKQFQRSNIDKGFEEVKEKL